jgi:hypothetical protein
MDADFSCWELRIDDWELASPTAYRLQTTDNRFYTADYADFRRFLPKKDRTALVPPTLLS